MSAVDTAESAVLGTIEDLFASFLEDDRARFDSHLDPTTTTWENHFAALYTREELDEYRDRRSPQERPALEEIRVEPRRIEVWGETAVAVYVMIAVLPDGTATSHRTTDVLRHDGRRWRIVHHHSQACDTPDADEVRA